MIRRLILHPTFRQMVRFGIVGFTTLLLDFSVYTGLTRGLPYFRVHFLQANAVAVALDIVWNFFWNNRWTFKRQGFGSMPQYVSYFAVALTGFGWNQLILWSLVRLGVNDLVAKLIAVPIIFFWNFFLQRAFTFGIAAAFAERRKTE